MHTVTVRGEGTPGTQAGASGRTPGVTQQHKTAGKKRTMTPATDDDAVADDVAGEVAVVSLLQTLEEKRERLTARVRRGRESGARKE